jgi:formate dehydrogenase major subunit
MAEAHPVGFQWVMEAKSRGATVIHVDPRYTRTSALADVHVPLRAGSDIAFVGALINHVLSNDLWFEDYVKAFTNASVILREDFQDTEDLDGLFSGYDPETRGYDNRTWQYDGVTLGPVAGQREFRSPDAGSDDSRDGSDGRSDQQRSGGGHQYAAGQQAATNQPKTDPTLQDPRCVFQVLKRHFARYTPEVVQDVCGVPPEQFLTVADALSRNSGRERTAAWVYSVGWTHHTVGVQYIRTAAILQLLLGNMGRPGGGVLALRGHANIQGATDLPTLFDLLPGYIPMPQAHQHDSLDDFIASSAPDTGFWGNMRDYMVSLLKSWWGENALASNDFCWDYLPRLTGDHSTYSTVAAQLDGTVKGYVLIGENPAVGSANAKMQRLGMAKLDWLVVRDFSLIESATWWKDGPEIETGELRTEDIATEVFFMPAAAHTEKSGSFTNTQRMLQWHEKAVEPRDEQRSDLWFTYHLGRLIREKLADSTDEMDRPLLDLTWDYRLEGTYGDPVAEDVLREVNGMDADGNLLSSYTKLKSDGSTSSGCWIYTGVFADDVNQSLRRKPASEQSWVAPEWGWAWPANRRILYNRASADPEGRPWSERKAYIWWDDEAGKWTGHDVADFTATKPPSYRPESGAKADDAIAGDQAFIMQADGRGWLFVPGGITDGPLPSHYEPHESPFTNPLYGQQSNPARQVVKRRENLTNPSGIDPHHQVFPYVFTTYRLTEHHTAGGMSRWVPYLSELQPEFFCEVSPELARERGLTHMGWATIVTVRTAIEARVMVTDRMAPLVVQGRTMHQVGLPYHWGPNGYVVGDAANEIVSVALDPNVHIQESKVGSCDIQPGRRPRGPALLAYVEEYRRRSGVTVETGQEANTVPADGGRDGAGSASRPRRAR